MPKIDKLMYHAIIPPFLIALVVLTFVVAVHELGTLSELLITRDVSIGVILTSMGAILPGILIFSLPLSYLIGILIGLTGLSGESQITALRACGVPLHKLLRAILLFGVIVGSATAVLSLVILPQTNDILRSVKNRISLTTLAISQIKPRVFNEDFPNIVFYLDDLATNRQHWSRVFLADNSDPKSPRVVIARSGTLITDSSSLRLQLHLEQGTSYSVNPEDPGKDNVSVFASTDIPIDTSRNSDSSDAMNAHSRKVTEQSSGYLWRNYRKAPPAERLEQQVELNRRLALPFSIVPFALLGLTLAVGAPKGGRTNGFALSLATVVAFYILFFNGLRLASVGKISPWLGAWNANILLVAAGLLLLRKVEQSFALSQWISALLWKSGWGALDRRFRRDKETIQPPRTVSPAPSSTGFACFRFPRILDLYISRGFLVFFFWSLMTCGTLFILFTLFDLLDDIIRNGISVSYVIAYFIFLTPQILMIVIPMSVLLAILINFGILEKNSEITAIKAGGWSLYRIAIPVFLLACGFCVSLFLVQDYVLPYANDRQDGLRNLIKGRPYQTSTRLQRKWIFGESGRIYNYEYFDGNQDSFVDLNVYEVDLNSASMVRRTYAARARIAPEDEWRLENGWIRDYKAQQSGFRRITLETTHFPEKAGYFEKEIFQPKESSKLTYAELKSYINYLMKSGYNATELQVELNKKISFPLSCVVMALLGVPFSFSTGKKGAFFGIGLSIAIGIAYWGIAGVFEAMGSHGLLVPVLAAWAPNIIFGASGLALLLTIRT